MTRIWTICFSLLLTAVSAPTRAQQTQPPQSEPPPETAAAAPDEDPTIQKDTENQEPIESKVERLSQDLEREKELRRQQQQELERVSDQLDELAFKDATQASSVDPGMKVFGFMDVALHKAFINKNDVLHGIVNDHLSFLIPHVNLYFSSTVNRTTTALVELRFGFFPQGQESFLPNYQRVNTTVVDPHTSEEIEYGGVSIQRAKITWTPSDAFGVTAGRFFTPFGIWNIDHSPTVVIPILLPWIMLRQTAPLAQTGAMVHGRFFPGHGLRFDYALTISNGRGPAESFYDVDSNKALGLRLKGVYESRDFRLEIGGYGYYGQSTDISKNVKSVLPLRLGVETTEQFTEIVACADLLFEIAGLRVQFESAWARRNYSQRPFKEFPIIQEPIPGVIQPDHIRYDLYGIIAYRFRIESFGGIDIEPWVMIERSVLDDASPAYTSMLGRIGVNFSPNPQFVLKLSALHMAFPDDNIIEHSPTYLSAQVAVSF